MKRVASLRYGVIFKKAFCDLEIFNAFASDVLGMPIEVEMVETEKTFETPIGSVVPRFDLFAEDTKNRVIIDIQHQRLFDHYDRFLYYHCVALLEQIAKANNYRPGLKVFTIVVLTSGDWHKRDVAITDFDPKDLDNVPLGEIPHKIFYLSPKYVSDKTPALYREWLAAINDSLDEVVDETQYHNDLIQKLLKIIERDHVTREDRTRMIEENHEEEMKQTSFGEGLAIGIKQQQRQTVRNMLAEALPLPTICNVMGLSEAEITQLLADEE